MTPPSVIKSDLAKLDSTPGAGVKEQLASPAERAVRLTAVLAVVALILGLALLSFPVQKDDQKDAVDFSSFYCAAQIVRQGFGRQLYDLGLQVEFQSKVAAVHAFFNHPPYEALLFVPFTFFSYRVAYILWTLASLGLLAIATFLIESGTKMSRAVSQYTRVRADLGLVFVLFLTFAPATTCLMLGENSMVTFLIYTLVFVLMRRGSDFAGGCVLALGLYKFQLIIPFVLILVLRRKWAAVRGFSATAVGLVLLSMAISGVEVIWKYPRLLFFDPTYQKVAGFNPEFMPNLRGFLYLLLDGKVPALAFGSLVAILSVLCLWWTAKNWRDEEFDLSFSAALMATLLSSYHLYNYDLILLLLPIAIVCGQLAARGQLLSATTLNIALTLLFIPPLHRLLLLHSIYALMLIPVLVLFGNTMRLARHSFGEVTV